MEKVNHIVITRKEERDLKRIKRLFEIMGIDYVDMASRVLKLEQQNSQKDEKIASLRQELAASKEENEKFIRGEMKQISVNIQKSFANSGSVKKPFNFEGSKIDEKY